MSTKKKYPKTVKKHPKNPKQGIPPVNPVRSNRNIEEFISVHATPASSDGEFIPAEWPGIDPSRTRIVRGVAFNGLSATEAVIPGSLGPDEDTVIFVDCSFDYVDGISFEGVNAVFHVCRFGHFKTGITTDLSLKMKACRLDHALRVNGSSDKATLEIEEVDNSECKLNVVDFPSVSVKKSSHNLLLIDCDSIILENITGSGDKELRIEYRYPPSDERDLRTHTLKFAHCIFDAPVYVSMNMSAVAIDLDDTFLDYLSLSNGTVRHINFDDVSSVGTLPAVECHFIAGYRSDRADTYPIRCSGAVNCGPITLFKKVRYFPWYALPFAGIEAFKGIPVVAELLVPANAERHIDRRSGKIRVSEAKVVGFYKIRPIIKGARLTRFVPFNPLGTVRSTFDRSYVYRKGETVVPKDGFERSSLTCAPGIHGFLDLDDAADY